MAAEVTDAASRRLDQVAQERKLTERERQQIIERALAHAERREWSQKKHGHEKA
jgi:predicted transcriptional regulator